MSGPPYLLSWQHNPCVHQIGASPVHAMPALVEALRFPGLRGLDEREIRQFVPEEGLALEQQEAEGRPGTSYEPFTMVAIVLLSASVSSDIWK